MIPQDNGKIDDVSGIRLLDSEEEKNASDNFVKLANAVQVLVNSTQRQVFTNLGLFALHSDKKTELGVANLFNGFASRLFYSGVTTYPCLQVRNIAEEAGASRYAVNFSTAFVDAVIGTPLEAHSMLKTFRLLGINVGTKELAVISSRAFFPFLVRNQLSWGVINNSEDKDILEKAGNAAMAGSLSTPLHNAGIKVMENSVGKNWKEMCNAVIDNFKSNPALLTRGIVARTVSIGMASILLSAKSEEILAEECRNLFRELPASSLTEQKAKKLVDAKTLTQTKENR